MTPNPAFDRSCFRYVGKAAEGADRPRKHYRRNVANLLAGRPYRKSKPTEFREVHRRLAEAVERKLEIRLSFLCNVKAGEDINTIEQQWQPATLWPSVGKELKGVRVDLQASDWGDEVLM